MAATTAASSSRVRYAPDDPTLPKPWRGLVDNSTGNLYFWNPETNVTQYERPVAPSHESSAPAQESLSLSDQKSPGHCSENNDENTYNNGDSAKFASGAGASEVSQVAFS